MDRIIVKNLVILTALMLSLLACKNSIDHKESDLVKSKKSSVNIEAVTYLKSDYSIPQELNAVWTYRDGYTSDQTYTFRNSISAISGQTSDDIGSYFFTHFNEHIHSAIVHRHGPISNLDYALMNDIEQIGTTTILGTMTLKQMLEDERSRMKAIAVVHNGKIVYENYIGLREWDNHIWASGTKILNGLLAYIAEKKGLLDLSHSIVKYLPELSGTQWEEVKVEDALHQRSGMDISEYHLISSIDHPVTLFYRIAQGDPSLPKETSLISVIQQCKKIRPPGILYEYASINTQVITLILERIYNRPLEDIISEEIWTKAGMEGDGTLGLSPSGEPMAFGIFSCRLRDFARFGMLFTPSWNVVSKEPIVSDDYFLKVKKAVKTEVYGEDYMSRRLNNDFRENNFGASYQWDAVFADGDLYKSGRSGQCLYISPETNTVVVWYS